MKRRTTSGYLPFKITKTEFKSEVGLSSYRATFENWLKPVADADYLSDEEWVIVFGNKLTQFLKMQDTFFAYHNQYLLKSLIEHGLLTPPWENDDE